MKLINLLPKEKQQELRDHILFQVVLKMIWLMVFTFALVLLAQFGARTYLQGQQRNLTQSIESLKVQVGKEENLIVKNKILELNNLSTDYKTLSASLPKISKVMRSFAPLVPVGVKISSMKIDPVKKIIDINGISPTRELVIQLYDNVVADSKNFPNIDYPLENVARPLDINFHFTFNIGNEVMK